MGHQNILGGRELVKTTYLDELEGRFCCLSEHGHVFKSSVQLHNDMDVEPRRSLCFHLYYTRFSITAKQLQLCKLRKERGHAVQLANRADFPRKPNYEAR